MATSKSNIIEPPKLDLSVDRYAAYKTWRFRWDDYVVVTKLGNESASYQSAMLRYSFSEETQRIYRTLEISEAESNNVGAILAKIETFAKGTINETMERHIFNSRNQEEGEPFDDFVTEVKVLSKNCNFCATCYNGLIRDRIVGGIQNDTLRQKLLAIEKLSLKKAEEECRANEKAIQGSKMISTKVKTDTEISEIRRLQNLNINPNRGNYSNSRGSRGRGGRGSSSNKRGGLTPNKQQPCKFCARLHKWGTQYCPAYGQKCNSCGQNNHFPQSNLCNNNKNLRSIDYHEQEDDVEQEFRNTGTLDFIFLDEVDEETQDTTDGEEKVENSEEEYFSCNESCETVQPVSKKRFRKRGKRKSKRNTIEKEEEFLCTLGEKTPLEEAISWEIIMPGTNGEIRFKIDTGADVSVIPVEELGKLGLNINDIKTTTKKLYGPGKEKLKCLGYIRTRFTWGKKTDEQLVYVCEGLKRALLGKPAINKLGIVKLHIPDSYACAEVEEETQDVHSDYPLLQEFPELYNRLGKISVGEPVKIKVKKGTTPHQTFSPRHIPLPQIDKVVTELHKMLKLGVIRTIDKPTTWCHPIVVVTKPNGDIRLCIDLTKLNAGVEREIHQLESVEETLAKLGNECIIMSKVDANSGYWQIPLDEQSQELTTFITPIGRFCCTRGPYGLNSMQEIFGKKMDLVIEGLKGVVKSTDDFLIFAKNKHALQERTRKLFERFSEHGVTINVKKSIFEKTEMEFLGHKITRKGILPIDSKMEAIQNFKQPTNITELRRFMGMANQMAKFNKDLAEASAPLRSLLSVKNMWVWTEEHSIAFRRVKEVITSPNTLKLYDVNLETKIRVDGSKLNGIAVILYQRHGDKWHPVTCSSRYLTPTEKNWFPIENEMLAVTWGCQKMNMYLHGLPHFTIETDHKPLIPILNNKQLIEMSPRIQNMRMKLLKYSFTATHVPGKEMEDADALSRSPHTPAVDDNKVDEEVLYHIEEVIKSMPASTEYLGKVREATKNDQELQQLQNQMRKGWPNSKQQCPKSIQPYWDSRYDMTEIDGLMVKGRRIIVPKPLRSSTLNRLHSAHQGMEHMKRRARQCVYWPGLNKMIEDMVNKCKDCLRYKPSKSNEPLKPHEVPTRPWEKVGTDLFQLKDSNYIIITDYYSLYPEVYELKRTKSDNVVAVLKDVFARHGIPTELVSDNGSQYISHQFRKFVKTWCFKHTTSSPRYPRSNGLAESSVKTIKSMLKKCLNTGLDIKMGLLSIRNTPLACGASPAELLMNRQLQDNLPRLPSNMFTNEHKQRDLITERIIQKKYHDMKIPQRNLQQHDTFRMGQHVAIQDPSTKEWSIRGKITKEIAPRSFTIMTDHGTTLRRNIKHIRRLPSISSYFEQHDNTMITTTPPYDSNSDNDTIPYDETSDQELALEEATHEFEQDIVLEGTPVTTRSGRPIKMNKPTDYDDL